MSDYDPARRIRLDDDVSVTDWSELRSIAREHMAIGHGDRARWDHDADRIRRALALQTYANRTFEVSCYGREDADQIRRRLNSGELLRVVFRRLW